MQTLKNNRQSFIHIGKERFFHLLPNEKLNTILKCIANPLSLEGKVAFNTLFKLTYVITAGTQSSSQAF